MKEIGQELFQSKNHREKLTDIAMSTNIGRVASCGDNKYASKILINLICCSYYSFKFLISDNFCIFRCNRSIKVHDISTLPETLAVINVEDDSGIEKLAWSEDGQLLAAATTSGSILIYLSKLPMLASAYHNYICVLTSLSQITIYLYPSEKVRLKYN